MKPELIAHRKFTRLRRLLGEPTPHLIGYLECMWLRGYQTGSPVLGDELDVEGAAEYPGERGRFTAAAVEAGFVDRNADGQYAIHDLYDHAPEWAKKRMARLGTAPEGALPSVAIKLRAEGKRLHRPPRGLRAEGETPNPLRAEDKDKKQETRNKNPPQSPPSGDPPPSGEEGGLFDSILEPEPAKPLEPKPARPPSPLASAIAEVAGLDPVTAEDLIRPVAYRLGRADPPYLPDDVREFGRRFWEFCDWARQRGRDRPTPREIENYIGRLRSGPPSRASPLPRSRIELPAEPEALAPIGEVRRLADHFRSRISSEKAET